MARALLRSLWSGRHPQSHYHLRNQRADAAQTACADNDNDVLHAARGLRLRLHAGGLLHRLLLRYLLRLRFALACCFPGLQHGYHGHAHGGGHDRVLRRCLRLHQHLLSRTRRSRLLRPRHSLLRLTLRWLPHRRAGAGAGYVVADYARFSRRAHCDSHYDSHCDYLAGHRVRHVHHQRRAHCAHRDGDYGRRLGYHRGCHRGLRDRVAGRASGPHGLLRASFRWWLRLLRWPLQPRLRLPLQFPAACGGTSQIFFR